MSELIKFDQGDIKKEAAEKNMIGKMTLRCYGGT